MDPIAEAPEEGHGQNGSLDPLQTLTSGRKREVRGGAFQAHICCVRGTEDVKAVMEAFVQADAFKAVTSWCYAYRMASLAPTLERPLDEGSADGLDEGCGERILGILRRFSLQGLLLIISRWQDYGGTAGLDLFGTELYAIVTERCKDLILNLKQAAGMNASQAEAVVKQIEKAPPAPKNFDFSFLPPIQEPRVPTKFGPNHFLSDSALNRPASLPNLFTGGDVRLWMKNDQILRNLPESEIWAMRFLRQPDFRVERVLNAVATVRGHKVPSASSTGAARWGHYREVLKSPTLRTELLLFDASTASLEACQEALDILSGLKVTDIRRASMGAAALYEWVQEVARWRLQGPPPPETAEKEAWIPLEPLQPRQAELSKTKSPLLPRARSGPRLRCSATTGSAGFKMQHSSSLPLGHLMR
uniref:Impact N-terminal domain-containing protein n=1 Tax=Pyrodinium bahamense TaxID=73915 RepID=A0A7S0FMS2_9DINO